MYNSSHSGDIVVVRYEAGAGGYRIVPITEEEFVIMMGGPHPKTAKTNKVFPSSNQPQPIFTESKEENRPPVPEVYRGGRIKESLNPESGILAKRMEISKHSRPLLAASSKEEEGSIIKKNSPIDGNASPPPILPAFLRPKVRTNRKVVFIIHVENIVRIRIAQRMVFMADDEKNTKKWFTKDVLGAIIFTILDTFKILTVTISQNMLNCLKLIWHCRHCRHC